MPERNITETSSILRLEDRTGHHLLLLETKEDMTYYPGSRHSAGQVLFKVTCISGSASKRSEGFDFGARVDTALGIVKLTNGYIYVPPELRSLGLGSMLFNKVIIWVKKFDHSIEFTPITIDHARATPDNLIRRNKFYSRFGILFSPYGNTGIEAGECLPGLKIGDLKTLVTHEKGIIEMSLREGLIEALNAASILGRNAEDLARYNERLKADVFRLEQRLMKKARSAVWLKLALVMSLSATGALIWKKTWPIYQITPERLIESLKQEAIGHDASDRGLGR